MTVLAMSAYLTKTDREADPVKVAQEEATLASRLTAAKVVTTMEKTGSHWVLTAKPKKD